MIRLMFLPFLLLAACGEAPSRAPAAGQEARDAMDAATAAYAACIEQATLQAPSGGVPGTVVGQAVRDCAPAREVLASKIVAFHRIGRPTYTQAQLDAVADASIKQIEPQLRSEAVAAYITRTSPNPKAD